MSKNFIIRKYVVKMTNKQELLKNYEEKVKILRETAKELNISDNELNKFIDECFLHAHNENYKISCTLAVKHKNTFLKFVLRLLKYLFLFLLFILLIIIVLHNHQPTFSLVLRNVQELVYPSLKLLRIFAVPVIKLFPHLSELYDESCLIENPYFEVSNMECWPCENVKAVLNSTKDFNPYSYETGVPYLTKSLQTTVNLALMKEIYKNNSKIFDTDAQRISSKSHKFNKISDILNFELSPDRNEQISWRINRMTPARVLRQYFTKPNFISEWSGQSTERYLFFDEPKAGPYVFPGPECSYILLTQGVGERNIVLKPSKECSGKCRTISVNLKEKYSLWYNWWYWRPISLPSENSTDISITYLTSYC